MKFYRPISRERAKYDISWSKQSALMNSFKTNLSEEMLKIQEQKVSSWKSLFFFFLSSKHLTALDCLQLSRWESHFRDFGRGISMFRTTDVINLIVEGIPDKLRQEIWLLFSGAIHEKDMNPGLYEDLVEKV